MTTDQAATIRRKWNQGGILQSCDHLNLESELNDLGDRMGNYVCILCGESVAYRRMDQVEAGTLPRTKVIHQYARTTRLAWNAPKMVD